MKRLSVGIVMAGLCLVVACNNAKKSEGTDAKATSAEAKDGKGKAGKEGDKAEKGGGELDHDALIKQASSLEGKKVTVKATSWGTSPLMDGKKRLNLGQGKLKGMRQAHLVADFEKDDASVDKVKKDDEVKLECTVGAEAHGARQLNGCKVL